MAMEMPRRPAAGAHRRIVLLALCTLAATAHVAQAEPFIAGTTPDQRPAGAPRIEKFDKSPQWYETATAGIVQPLPPSLKFLDDQGAWYTPFILPGMNGRYDIRGRHANGTLAAKTNSQASH